MTPRSSQKSRFRSLHKRDICELTEITETWRCRQEIVDLADRALPARLAFPATTSHESTDTEHDGVFVVAPQHVRAYVDRWNRNSSSTLLNPYTTHDV